MALLRSTPLTEEQVREVVRHIRGAASPDQPLDHDEIAEFIEDVTHHDAGSENINRVAAKLAAVGWPLAGMGDGAP